VSTPEGTASGRASPAPWTGSESKANVLFFDRKPPREDPWTSKLWVYDLRTKMHFTLKTNPLRRADLDEFVTCYHPATPRRGHGPTSHTTRNPRLMNRPPACWEARTALRWRASRHM
jgi:hypothetical protein